MENNPGRSSRSSNHLQPAEVTQPPKSDIGTGLDYFMILEQQNRKFALSHDWYNLYVLNLNETVILGVYTPHKKFEKFNWKKVYGKYSDEVEEVCVSDYTSQTPRFCQVKIKGTTKTYEHKGISKIEV